ncbi:hypothetical protein LTR78_005703 [Recurvomyces mirabilis]|uniref:chitinase n=1 Tax=Recurvomyces mirabilis TaxID=574656 RepID=A0AAE0WM38_9PEZI|nr:hypothetical protein LTR78_005703 [Recurvomyces mirabilis]KAK5154084.1 hypothetical protein LTS14_006769 [Recurvomyces mirabilis]
MPEWSVLFCGSTDDFCGDGCQAGFGGCGPPPTPPCGGSQVGKRNIGYYESWANTRQCQAVSPKDLNLAGFSHLNFAFASFDPKSSQITPMDSNSASLYGRTTGLKNKWSGLEVWISVGGWSFTDPGPTQEAFSNMVSTAGNRQAFISGLMQFMNTYNFDGVDLDWEYPQADDRGGQEGDKVNYVTFVKELRSALGNKGISLTLPASFWYLQHIDVKGLQDSVDWFNFMAYDLHGTWDKASKFVGPYIAPHTTLTEIDLGLDLLWRAGVSADKVVLGQGWYGRSFTLTNPSCKTPNGVCEFSGGADPGPCSATSGILDDQEIQDIITKNNVQPVWDKTAGVKWITWGSNQWVSYDDDDTFNQKRDFAEKRCLGGLMVWALDQKDQSGAGNLNNGVSAGDQSNAQSLSGDAAAKASCYVTDCNQKCKSGTNQVAQMNGQPGQVSTRTEICAVMMVLQPANARGEDFEVLACRVYKGAQMTNSHVGKKDQTCNGGLQSFCCSNFKAPPSLQSLGKDAADAAKSAAEAAAEQAALDIAAKAFCRIAVPALLAPIELLEDLIPIFGEIADIAELAATPALIKLCTDEIEKTGKAEFKVFGKKHSLSLESSRDKTSQIEPQARKDKLRMQ